VVVFQRGTRPATAGGVDAGTCAWMDRGIRPDEPNEVCFGRSYQATLELHPLTSTLRNWIFMTAPPLNLLIASTTPSSVGAGYSVWLPGSDGSLLIARARTYRQPGYSCLEFTQIGA
jgi:hypothetical protein